MNATQSRSNQIRFNTPAFSVCIFLFTHLPFLEALVFLPLFFFLALHTDFFYTFFFMFKDLRKKGSARRLILINSTLEDPQKKEIARVGFGGLLLVQCLSVPEKLSSWLIKRFDVTRSELVIPYRGRIKVDDHAVHRILGLPMVGEHIDYAKNSFADTYEEFYKVFNHENDQKAPTFTEAENWLLGEGKKRSDTLWLWYWLEFAISSFLCPTSNPSLCVQVFHAIADIEKIDKYNWCRLVVEKLIRGITEFNEVGKKSVSGCLFLLTVRWIIPPCVFLIHTMQVICFCPTI